jgi:TetR/AcrR family transcriptional regulator, cholesterol catabolism regulator
VACLHFLKLKEDSSTMATFHPTEADAPENDAIRVRVDNRPEQIIRIATRLFARHGYEGTSLRDIAEEAKITKAALYYHFPNKEALYQRIVLDSLRSLIETVRTAIDLVPSPLEKVRQFMLVSADIMEGDRDRWMAGSNIFWTAGDNEYRKLNVALRNEYESVLRTCIADAVKSGQFRSVNVALTGRLFLSLLSHLSRWHNPKGAMAPREVVEQYLEMSFHGLVP